MVVCHKKCCGVTKLLAVAAFCSTTVSCCEETCNTKWALQPNDNSKSARVCSFKKHMMVMYCWMKMVQSKMWYQPISSVVMMVWKMYLYYCVKDYFVWNAIVHECNCVQMSLCTDGCGNCDETADICI